MTHVQTNEGTCYQQEQGEVAGSDIQSADHDGTTNGRENDGDNNMVSMLQHAARVPRHEQCNQERHDRWRCLNEVGRDLVETKSRHDGGQEILVGLSDNESEMDEREHVRDGVLQHGPDSADVVALIIFRETTCRNSLPVLRHGGLFGCQEVGARVVGEVGDEPESAYANDDTDDAFEQEEPLPRVKAGNVVHVGQNTRREETRDGLRNGVSGVPNTHSQGRLLLRVPRRGHE